MLANKAAKSSESTHTNPILVLLDDIFKNPDLVKEAEKFLKGTSDDEIDIKLCELLRLPSRKLSNEDYVKEENRLRDELGKAFQDRTGCTLNFGQGLSLEDLCIRVIIIMNYATKECEGYEGSDWLDLMDLNNGCIHLWYKGTEAAEIHAILLEDGFSSKEAMEWILSELSEAHYNLYDACLRVGKKRTEAKEMYHKLIDTEKLSREQALDRIEKDLSVKHRKLYEASLKVGDMKTEAKDMYHKLMKEENMTREIALNRIEKELSTKHRKLYEGCLKTGDMKTEAMDMFDELMKEEGMTREIALTRIGKKLSVKHRKLYERSLKPEMYVERYTQLIAQNYKQIKLLARANKSLAAGWTAHIDKKSEKVFYYNKEQNKSTWERLTATGWTAHIDKKSGKTFYYNKEQKKSTWVLPETNLPQLQSTSVTKATNKPKLVHGKFTEEEDLRLWKAFNDKGRKWSTEYFKGKRSGPTLKERIRTLQFKSVIDANFGIGTYDSHMS